MDRITNFKHRQNAESINQALKLLLQEQLLTPDDIKGITEKDSARIQAGSMGLGKRLNSMMGNIQKASRESLGRATSKVDRSAHQSPWIFVGVATALSGITGYFLAQRLRVR